MSFYALVLIAIVETGFAIALSVACVAQWWSLKQLTPQVELRKRILQLESDSQAFSDQIIRLRTQKAGRASKARKEEAMARQEESQDPELDGLSEDERALFM